MIDEKKLIEDIHKYFYKKIEELTGEVCDDSPVTKEERKLYTMNKEICGIIKAQPTIEPYGTWIPCSERLPKEAEEYHVTQYKKNAVNEYCDGYRTARIFFDDHGWWDDVDALAGWEIIAWMPLPEPYRKEKK